MAVYERETRIDAPLSTVWAFYSTVDGLRALTPSWMNLRIHEIARRDDRDSHVLDAGTTLTLSVQPFGVGPRQEWTTRIEERGERDGTAYFVDVMEDGPFPHWRHTHLFYSGEDETLLRDRVEYELPVVPRPFDPLGNLGMAAFFRYRHRRTHEILVD